MKKKLAGFAAAALMLSAATAQALPALQVYIPGATYDAGDQTWMTNSNRFDLWVIGSGDKEPIYDVFLAAAFKTGEKGSITFTPTKAGAGDPSAPTAPVLAKTGQGTAPLMGDNSALPSAGVYGADTSWQTYALGNFTANDSPIGDYSNTVPTTLSQSGQINAYTVDITGYTQVHFDAFDHVAAGNSGNFKSVAAPFSHDAEVTPPTDPPTDPVPEPGTMMLLGGGLLGLAIYGKRRQKA